MTAELRVAVIGAGAMGRNHARIYHQLDRAELVGVADPNSAAAAASTSLYGGRAYAGYAELLDAEKPDAVSIAVPTDLHHETVMTALAAGCHVLVEKPIAQNIRQGMEMVAAAQREDRLLMVGHVERYNPAIKELKRRLGEDQLGHLFQAQARRLGPFPARVRDVGVVIDLATHDLDIMRYIGNAEPVRLYAETRRQVHGKHEDQLSALIRFDDDMLGVLDISWLTPTKIRELFVTGERGMFRADYLTQDLFFYENAETSGTTYEPLRVLRGVSEGVMTRYAFTKEEPLRQELSAFVDAALGLGTDIVTGADGLMALRMALALIRSAKENRALTLHEQ